MKNRKIINNQQQQLQKKNNYYGKRAIRIAEHTLLAANTHTHTHTQAQTHWLEINRRIILSKWDSLNCWIRPFRRTGDFASCHTRSSAIQIHSLAYIYKSICMRNIRLCSIWCACSQSMHNGASINPFGSLLFYVYLVSSTVVWQACRTKWIRERPQITFTLYHQTRCFFFFVVFLSFSLLFSLVILQFIFILLVFINMIS